MDSQPKPSRKFAYVFGIPSFRNTFAGIFRYILYIVLPSAIPVSFDSSSNPQPQPQPTNQPQNNDTTMSDTKEAPKAAPTFSEIMNKSAKSAIRGGTAGAVAMGANVAALMWMRTTVSRQKSTSKSQSNRIQANFGDERTTRHKKECRFLEERTAMLRRTEAYLPFSAWVPPVLRNRPRRIRLFSVDGWDLGADHPREDTPAEHRMRRRQRSIGTGTEFIPNRQACRKRISFSDRFRISNPSVLCRCSISANALASGEFFFCETEPYNETRMDIRYVPSSRSGFDFFFSSSRSSFSRPMPLSPTQTKKKKTGQLPVPKWRNLLRGPPPPVR